MLSEPRAIFFETVLEWPPFEVAHFKITEEIIRKFYNQLFEAESVVDPYRNLDLQGDPPTLSSKHELGGYSQCRFGANSIAFEENSTQHESGTFSSKVAGLLGEYAKIFPDSEEPPPVIFQKCRIRCLSQPGYSGSLDLLASRVARVSEQTTTFGRPPSFFGVRFRFPPVDIESESGQTESHDNYTTIRFETYAEDISQVWMEIAATHFFPTAIEITTQSGREQLADRITSSYLFLTEKCKSFLDQYDLPGNEGEANENHL